MLKINVDRLDLDLDLEIDLILANEMRMKEKKRNISLYYLPDKLSRFDSPLLYPISFHVYSRILFLAFYNIKTSTKLELRPLVLSETVKYGGRGFSMRKV